MKDRSLTPTIRKDLQHKMVFLAGPRQVGKTTLAKTLLAQDKHGTYYSWDNREDRRRIKAAEWPGEGGLVVLDELHKAPRWKTWLKGEYDTHHPRVNFLVTGSARMDVYRRGGDSLQGRYHHHRLHPFSLAELEGRRPSLAPFHPLSIPEGSLAHRQTLLERLLRFSGFPEPLFAQDDTVHRRWQKERVDRVVREDIRDLEPIRDVGHLEMLGDLLPSKVGSLLSLNAIREDLEVSHRAVSHWMDIFERLYVSFRVRPYTSRAFAGLKKEPKLYLWDWSQVESPSARLENLVALHLLKLCHWLEDTEGHEAELHFLRDPQKREVDFLVAVKHRPWMAVEVKTNEAPPSPHLTYFGERLNIPFKYQVALEGSRDVMKDGVRLLPAASFLAGLA